MPYLSGRTEDVQAPLFSASSPSLLGITEVFGRSLSYWNRLECSLGRSSLVGTTVSSSELLLRHLVADEQHTTLGGEKVDLAATAGGGCCLGLALAKTARADDLTDAYGVFRKEAHRLDPRYAVCVIFHCMHQSDETVGSAMGQWGSHMPADLSSFGEEGGNAVGGAVRTWDKLLIRLLASVQEHFLPQVSQVAGKLSGDQAGLA